MNLQVESKQEGEVLKKILGKKRGDLTHTELAFIANRIRQHIVDMVAEAKCGHPGGPMGLADIYATLYFRVMNYDVKSPNDADRDRFILSNGHVCAGRYAVMALAGYLPTSELKTFRQLGSRLQGHPSTRFFPELENSSGSLGQGLSNAGGLALGLRLQKLPSTVYACISDGECQEGMTWEAATSAVHYKLDNLVAFVDFNNIQIDGYVENVMDVGDLRAKFESFGWLARDADGHDFKAIEEAFEWSKKREGAPKVIVFKTTLGKGVSFMENEPGWHGVAPKPEQRDEGITELKKFADSLMKDL